MVRHYLVLSSRFFSFLQSPTTGSILGLFSSKNMYARKYLNIVRMAVKSTNGINNVWIRVNLFKSLVTLGIEKFCTISLYLSTIGVFLGIFPPHLRTAKTIELSASEPKTTIKL